MMKKILPISIFILLLLTETTVLACRCNPPDVARAWKDASLVVRVKVDDVIILPSGEGSSAIVTVAASWKKDSPKRLVVSSFTNCAFNWKAGKEYVLFLRKESNGLYSSDRCMGNRPGNDLDAIKWLDQHGQVKKVK